MAINFLTVNRKNGMVVMDGYTTCKYRKNALKDIAKAVAKIDANEGQCILDQLDNGEDPEVKNTDRLSYCLELEEVGCATRYNEDCDDMDYAEGKWYFLIRFEDSIKQEGTKMANKIFKNLLVSECAKAAKLANTLTGRNDAYVSAWSHDSKTDTEWSIEVNCEISFRDTDDMPDFYVTVAVMLFNRRMSYAFTFGNDQIHAYIKNDNAKDYAGAFPLPCDKKEEDTKMTDKDQIVKDVLTERAINMTKNMIEDRVTASGAYFVIDADSYIDCESETSKIVHGSIGLISEVTAADIMDDVRNTVYDIFGGKCPLYVIPDNESDIFWRIYEDAKKADTKADLTNVYADLTDMYKKDHVCHMTYRVLMSALDAFGDMISTPTNELSVQEAQEIVSHDFALTVTSVCQGDAFATIFCDWHNETKKLTWSWSEHKITQIETL